MPYDPLDPAGDPFGPPTISTMVGCIHCGESYDSYRIEWRVSTGCDGIGFGFDILPVDPNYHDEHGGWIHRDDEDDEFDDFEDEELPLLVDESERRKSPPKGEIPY